MPLVGTRHLRWICILIFTSPTGSSLFLGSFTTPRGRCALMQSDGLADLLDGFAGAAAVFDIEWKFLVALLGIVFSGVATLVSTIVFCISTSPVARVRERASLP